MSDILEGLVERLWDHREGLCKADTNEDLQNDLEQAAQEIRKLREEIERLKRYATECPECGALMIDLENTRTSEKKKEEEIRKLREEVMSLQDDRYELGKLRGEETLKGKCQALRAERDKLREELEEARADKYFEASMYRAAAERDKLREELEDTLAQLKETVLAGREWMKKAKGLEQENASTTAERDKLREGLRWSLQEMIDVSKKRKRKKNKGDRS